jgi:hypothetical protein
MAVKTSTNHFINHNDVDDEDDDNDDDNDDGDDDDDRNNRRHHTPEFDQDNDDTEEDLIANYHYLTRTCGILRPTPTMNTFDTSQVKKYASIQANFSRAPYSYIDEHDATFEHDTQDSMDSNQKRYSSFKSIDLLSTSNNDLTSTISRVPPTIYYDDNSDDQSTNKKYRSFSVVRLFTRMKARLKHDRYQAQSAHKRLAEDPSDWFRLASNTRVILAKALLPDGGCDPLPSRSPSRLMTKKFFGRTSTPSNEINQIESIHINIDDHFNTDGDEDYDKIIWNDFLKCSRGIRYRRCGLCKVIDRQYHQGQLAFVYNMASNILIDENLKASGLG